MYQLAEPNDSLHEGREPWDQWKCLASISVGIRTSNGLPWVLFVESEINPAHKPSKLDYDPGALEANKT